jgi:hypothetical protein
MTNLRIIAAIVALVFFWGAADAEAQDIEVLLDGTFSDTTGMNANQVKGELDDAIQANLNLEGQEEYLAQMSKASAMASRGMGVDYFVLPKRVVVGASVGSSANGGGLIAPGDSLMPQGGFAWQLAGMAGLNLGAISPKDGFARRFVVFANGMAMTRQRDPFTASSTNLGAHLQVRLVKPRSLVTAEWGGIALTSGYERATYEMTLSQTTTLDAGEVSWEPAGSYTISSISEAVPIELSTSLRVLFFGLYGGAALDIPLQTSADAAVELDGDIYTRIDGSRVNVGRATVRVDSSVPTEDWVTRFFTGVQFKLAVAHAYTHLNVGTDKSVGLHMGVRVGL